MWCENPETAEVNMALRSFSHLHMREIFSPRAYVDNHTIHDSQTRATKHMVFVDIIGRRLQLAETLRKHVLCLWCLLIFVARDREFLVRY